MATETQRSRQKAVLHSIKPVALAKRAWEPLSVVIALFCVAVAVFYVANRLLSDDCGFCPIELAPLEVRPNPLVLGEPAMLLDGLCNKGQEPVTINIALTLEPAGSALNPAMQPRELVNSMRNMDAGQCIAERPIRIDVVDPSLPIGTWRLAVRVTARSRDGRMQIVPQTSPYFDIVRP